MNDELVDMIEQLQGKMNDDECKSLLEDVRSEVIDLLEEFYDDDTFSDNIRGYLVETGQEEKAFEYCEVQENNYHKNKYDDEVKKLKDRGINLPA